MNKKKTILIIIGVIALIALFIVLLNANQREYESESTLKEGTNGEEADNIRGLPSAGGTGGALQAEVALKQASPEEIEEENIKNLAKIFVERWGSWSTDGDFSNFESLKAQMTEDGKKVIDEKKLEIRNWKLEGVEGEEGREGEEGGGGRDGAPARLRHSGGLPRLQDEGGFYGVTTKALSAKIEGKTGNSASVMVSYQKQETIGEDADVSYGEAAVELIKEGEKWKIAKLEIRN